MYRTYAPARTARRFGRLLLVLTVLALLVAPTAALAQDDAPLGQLRQELGREGLRESGARGQSSFAYPVVAAGLDNPRGLTFATDGRLLVAEAGRGGDDCFLLDPEDPASEVCAGYTGAITAIDLRRGLVERIATGLPSWAGPGGAEVAGPHDVVNRGSNIYALTGLGNDPAVRQQFGGPWTDMGYLWHVVPADGNHKLVDISAYEAEHNPDGFVPDSNPYSFVSLGAQRFVVADAGGNSLLFADAGTGAISTLAVFPPRVVPVAQEVQDMFGLPPEMPAESVLNSVAIGPDSALYVGELLGFPFTPGQSRVYRVVPGQEPTVFAEGFTAIIDIAFGPDGSLYVLEIAKNGLIAGFLFGDFTGALIKVDPQGNKTEIASEGLTAPGGVAINAAGHIYVTNNSTFPAIGEVLRIK